jgi:hypothetical protein
MTSPSPIVEPGYTGQFVYVGEMIPNQVLIRNLGDTEAEYWLVSGKDGWAYYGSVPVGETSSILVEWFNSVGTFGNPGRSAIEIGGDGIFPYDSATGEAVKE